MKLFLKFVASLVAKGFASKEEKEQVALMLKELSTEEQAEVKPEAEEATNLPETKPEPAKDEELDEKAVTSLIQKSVSEAVEKQIGKEADNIVKEFFSNVAKNRKAAIDTGKDVAGDKKANDVTRKFVKALFNGDKETLKALTTATNDDAKAGYTIPSELMAEVLRIAGEKGVARSEMRYLPFSGPGNERKVPTIGSSVTVSWVNEGAKKPGTKAVFGLVTQTLKKLAAIVPLTEEVIEDSAINLTELIATLFAEAVATEEDAQFFAGSGSPWTGILNNASVVKTTTQLDPSLKDRTLADDLLTMQDSIPAKAAANAKYYMNRTWLTVIRTLKDANGNYIYQNPGQGQPATLWNKPVTLVDSMPAFSEVQAGDQFVIFTDLKQTCIFGDKQELRVKMLDQATITDADGSTVINLAEQDMVAVRVVERVGYVVALPAGIAVLEAGAATSL